MTNADNPEQNERSERQRLEQGIHPRVVQERFGHSSISITLGMYSHVGPTLHDEAAETIAGLIMSDTR